MLGDCLERMKEIECGTVDLVLTDLPYGTTQNKWDSVLPLDQLWAEYRRIAKPNAAVVLTASQPFTSALVMSNTEWFKYDWTWRKPKGTGHLNAKQQPMRDKEDILVFYARQPTYNPQFTYGKPYTAESRGAKRSGSSGTSNYGSFGNDRNASDGRRYPKQVIEFTPVEVGTVHPTQKPVALMEYLIRTYAVPGMTVLDNTMGSGTTGVAALRCGCDFIGIELDPSHFETASARIDEEAIRLATPAPQFDLFAEAANV